MLIKYFYNLKAKRAERAAQKRNASKAWFKKLEGLLYNV